MVATLIDIDVKLLGGWDSIVNHSSHARHSHAAFSGLVAQRRSRALPTDYSEASLASPLLYAQLGQLKETLRRQRRIRVICELERLTRLPHWIINKASSLRSFWVKCGRRVAALVLPALCCSALLSPAYAIEESDGATSQSPEGAFVFPKPFEAIYTADYRGLPISATGIRSLRREDTQDSQRYIFSSRAVSLFAKLNEASTFTLESNQLVPARYQYERTGLGKNKTQDTRFDWASGLANDVALDEAFTFNPSTLFSDRLLYQLRLQVDLINTPVDSIRSKTWTYLIFDRGRMKEYVFEMADEESIDTALGTIDTIRLERKNEDSSRRTTLWLAPSLEYMLIRFVQEDDGDSFSLALKEAVLDGRPVQLDEEAKS
jgi:hypothetical protein